MRQDEREATPEVDFVVEKYRLDRAHELELNRFTHVLEMERLKLLTVLNGGAAAAWLTFYEGGAAQGGWGAAALVLPSILWLLGLILASVATHAALQTQRAFTQAYHRARRADEWRILRRSHGGERLAEMLPSPGREETETEERAYRRLADDARRTGEAAAARVILWTFRSVAVFVLGAVAAGALTLVVWAGQRPVPPAGGG